MTDRELLEAAAKAARIETLAWNEGLEAYSSGEGFILPSNYLWNPLTDDDDALRLAVSLRITVEQCLTETKVSAYVLAGRQRNHCKSISGAITREQATRHAIVSVAAEIGRGMP